MGQEGRDVSAAAGVADAATIHRALLIASSLRTEKGAAAIYAPEPAAVTETVRRRVG